MSKPKAALGALFSVALCLCAFGVANASAANVEAHTCFNAEITAGSTQRYSNSECTTTEVGGAWGWKLIPAGKTEVEVSMGGASSLSATVGGTFFRIACTGIEGEGKVENAGGKIQGSEIVLKYTGCSVTNPVHRCEVAAILETKPLKAISSEMSVKYEPEGAEFIVIEVKGAPPPALPCPMALLGKKAVTGQATAIVPEMGNIEEFTEFSGSALEYGGQAATFLGSNSAHMKGTSNTVGAVTP